MKTSPNYVPFNRLERLIQERIAVLEIELSHHQKRFNLMREDYSKTRLAEKIFFTERALAHNQSLLRGDK